MTTKPYSESEWTSRLMAGVKECGGLVLPVVAHKRGEPGWPDRMVIHKRWMGFVEVKVDGRMLTTLQRIRIRDICSRRPLGAVVARRMQFAPGKFIIEDEVCNMLAEFDGSGQDLIDKLAKLSMMEGG